mmetsp:Transcript_10882/g.27935  ORF Transcript_10882/g.27935 Transcript_10882/m.27935 type:complete len:357 (-) Transcript_10882:755-1825(-)
MTKPRKNMRSRRRQKAGAERDAAPLAAAPRLSSACWAAAAAAPCQPLPASRNSRCRSPSAVSSAPKRGPSAASRVQARACLAARLCSTRALPRMLFLCFSSQRSYAPGEAASAQSTEHAASPTSRLPAPPTGPELPSAVSSASTSASSAGNPPPPVPANATARSGASRPASASRTTRGGAPLGAAAGSPPSSSPPYSARTAVSTAPSGTAGVGAPPPGLGMPALEVASAAASASGCAHSRNVVAESFCIIVYLVASPLMLAKLCPTICGSITWQNTCSPTRRPCWPGAISSCCSIQMVCGTRSGAHSAGPCCNRKGHSGTSTAGLVRSSSESRSSRPTFAFGGACLAFLLKSGRPS